MCESCTAAVIAAGPDIDDNWKSNDYCRHLRNAEHQRDDRQHTSHAYPGQQQREPDQESLNRGDSDDTERDSADGRDRKFRKRLSS